MIADYFTKPIQGKEFYELKSIIMCIIDTLLVKQYVKERAKVNLENVQTNNEIPTG